MKTSILVLVAVLLASSQAHKHASNNEEIVPIYKPFEDVPTPDQVNAEQDEAMDKKRKQENVEQFNEMLRYGLIFGTILLACTLFKTCAIDTHPRQNHRTARRQQMMEIEQGNTRSPMLSHDLGKKQINEQISYHESQIKKLKHMEKEIEAKEQQRMEIEMRRQEIMVQYYQSQQQNIQPQQYYYEPQSHGYYGNIPVGRPLPNGDNNSSFASDYPTL